MWAVGSKRTEFKSWLHSLELVPFPFWGIMSHPLGGVCSLWMGCGSLLGGCQVLWGRPWGTEVPLVRPLLPQWMFTATSLWLPEGLAHHPCPHPIPPTSTLCYLEGSVHLE